MFATPSVTGRRSRFELPRGSDWDRPLKKGHCTRQRGSAKPEDPCATHEPARLAQWLPGGVGVPRWTHFNLLLRPYVRENEGMLRVLTNFLTLWDPTPLMLT